MVVVEKSVLFVSSAWTDEAKFNASVKKGAGRELVYVDELIYGVNAFRSVSDAYAYTASTGESPISLCVYDKSFTAVDLSCFSAGATDGDELIASLFSLNQTKNGTVTMSAWTPQGSFGTAKASETPLAKILSLTGFKDVFLDGASTDQVFSVTGGSLSVKMNFATDKVENAKKGTRTETVSFSGKITNAAAGTLDVSSATVLTPKFTDMYNELYSEDMTEETICAEYSIAAAGLSVIPLHSYDWQTAFENYGKDFCVSSQQTVNLTDAVIGSDVHGGKYSYELTKGTVQCAFSDFSLLLSVYQTETEKCAYTEKITKSATGSFTAENLSANKSVWNAEKEIFEPSETDFTSVNGFTNVKLTLTTGNVLGSFDSNCASSEKKVETADTRQYNASTEKYEKINRNNVYNITEKTTRKTTGSFAVSGTGTFRGSEAADNAVCGYKSVSVQGKSATEKISFETGVCAGDTNATKDFTFGLTTTENTKKGVTIITEIGNYAQNVKNVERNENVKAQGTLTAANADFAEISHFDKVVLNANCTAKSIVAGSMAHAETCSENGSAAQTTVYSITDSTRNSYDEIYRKTDTPVATALEIGTKAIQFTTVDKNIAKAGLRVTLNNSSVTEKISGYATVDLMNSKAHDIACLLAETTASTEKQCSYDIEIAAGSDTPTDVLTSVTQKEKNTEKYSFASLLNLISSAVSGDVCGYKKVKVQDSELKSALTLSDRNYSEMSQTVSAQTTILGTQTETDLTTWKCSFPTGELNVTENSKLGDVSGYGTVKITGSSVGSLTNCLSGSETKKIVRTWLSAADYEAGLSPTSTLTESYQGKYSIKGTAKIVSGEVSTDVTGYNTLEISGDSTVKGSLYAISAAQTLDENLWNTFSFSDSGENRYFYDKSSTEIDAVSSNYKEKTEQTGAKSVKITDSAVNGSVNGYSNVTITSAATVQGGVSNVTGEYSDAVKDLKIAVPEGAANKVQCEYVLTVSTSKTDDTVISRVVNVKIANVSGGTFTLNGQSSVKGDVCGFATVKLTDGSVGGSLLQTVATVTYMKDDEFLRSGSPEMSALERYDADLPSISGTETVISTVAAGKATVSNSTIGGKISGYENVTVTKSTIQGGLASGNTVKTVSQVTGQPVSTQNTFTAAGSLTIKGNSSVNADVFGFLSVSVTDSTVDGCISSKSQTNFVSDKTKTALTLSNAAVSSILNYKTITVKSGVNYVNAIYADSVFQSTISIAKKAVLSVSSFSRGAATPDYIAELSVKGEFDFTGTENDFSGKSTITVTGSGNIYATEKVLENRLNLEKFKGKTYSLGAAENAGANFRCAAYEQADDISDVDIGSFEAGDTYAGWLSAEVLDAESSCDDIFNDLTDNLQFENIRSQQLIVSGFDNDVDVMTLMMDSAQNIILLSWNEQDKTFSCDLTAGETYSLYLSYNGITADATNYQLAFVMKTSSI